MPSGLRAGAIAFFADSCDAGSWESSIGVCSGVFACCSGGDDQLMDLVDSCRHWGCYIDRAAVQGCSDIPVLPTLVHCRVNGRVGEAVAWNRDVVTTFWAIMSWKAPATVHHDVCGRAHASWHSMLPIQASHHLESSPQSRIFASYYDNNEDCPDRRAAKSCVRHARSVNAQSKMTWPTIRYLSNEAGLAGTVPSFRLT